MTMKEYRTRRKADIDEIVADTTRCGIIGFAVAVLSAVVIKGLGGSIFTEQGITSFIFVRNLASLGSPKILSHQCRSSAISYVRVSFLRPSPSIALMGFWKIKLYRLGLFLLKMEKLLKLFPLKSIHMNLCFQGLVN